jgi:6-phosphogluconolactonase
MHLYVGGYTKNPEGEGIGVYRFDPESGAIEHIETVGGIVNPSYLALGPDGRTLYAVAESPAAGSVVACARDPEKGTLRELNRQSSQGNGPCHLSIDATGRFVLVANYGSGSIAALPIGPDGRLEPASSAIQHEGSSVNPDRQEGPHAHMILPTPDGRHVYATDLGADRVFGYTLDATGTLAADPDAGGPAAQPGAGPRHVAYSPNGATVYVINELDSTLTSYTRDARSGRLTPRLTVPTLPDDFDGQNSCAHVVVAPDGRFVYGSNRGHDSIAIWAADANGALDIQQWVSAGGRTPRNFALSPDGAWLLVANQDSGSIVVMRRNPETGLPEEPGITTHAPSPCCLVFAGE